MTELKLQATFPKAFFQNSNMPEKKCYIFRNKKELWVFPQIALIYLLDWYIVGQDVNFQNTKFAHDEFLSS